MLTRRPGTDEWYQVDADFVGSFVASFLDHLKLSKAYNILILNPKRAALPGRYGYRIGLSPADLLVLQQVRPDSRKSVQPFWFPLSSPVQAIVDRWTRAEG